MTARKVLLVFCALVLVLSFGGCKEEKLITNDALTGIWYTHTNADNRYEVFEFRGDGTGNYSMVIGDEVFENPYPFTYVIDGNTLSLTTDGDTVKYDYKYNGKVLTLKNGGMSVDLEKQAE